MTLGLIDLSLVTDRLIARLKDAASLSPIKPVAATPPYSIGYIGLAPDVARTSTEDASCLVSVYLFHVAADKFYRNTFPTGGAPPTPEQPLALTLYYLVTAYSRSTSSTAYIEEQQAMSIVLKCFHENPIVRDATPGSDEDFTLTIEPQSVDEAGRLWQSVNHPMRLSAMYRVGVIFLEAPEVPAPKVVRHPPDFAPPREDLPPHHVLPLPSIPAPSEASATADRTGLATISGAGFVTGATKVRLRALTLIERTTTGPLSNRQFHVDRATALSLRVPLFTPAGRYLVTVQPAAETPALEVWLTLAQLVDTVGVVGDVAAIAIDDAHFATASPGPPEVKIDGVAATLSTAPPLLPGQFRVVDPSTLELRISTATAASTGRHRITVRPAAGQPEQAFWLVVP